MSLDFPPDLELECLKGAINVILERSWTDAGVASWWARSRTELDGFTPLQMIESPTEADRQRVIWLADAGRESGGS